MEQVTKAKNLTNIAYMVADIAHSICMDAESAHKQAGQFLRHQEKHKWGMLYKAIHELKSRLHFIITAFNEVSVATDFAAAEESDNYYDMIMLLFDRVGENEERMNEVREYLKALPSELTLYKSN